MKYYIHSFGYLSVFFFSSFLHFWPSFSYFLAFFSPSFFYASFLLFKKIQFFCPSSLFMYLGPISLIYMFFFYLLSVPQIFFRSLFLLLPTSSSLEASSFSLSFGIRLLNEILASFSSLCTRRKEKTYISHIFFFISRLVSLLNYSFY